MRSVVNGLPYSAARRAEIENVGVGRVDCDRVHASVRGEGDRRAALFHFGDWVRACRLPDRAPDRSHRGRLEETSAGQFVPLPKDSKKGKTAFQSKSYTSTYL